MVITRKATVVLLALCLVHVEAVINTVLVAKTENYIRCRKLCTYTNACVRVEFKYKTCLLISDPSSSRGEQVIKSRVPGKVCTNDVCDKDSLCAPTGDFGLEYTCHALRSVLVLGTKEIYFGREEMGFDKAQEACQQNGGQLFVVENGDEWLAIVDFIGKHPELEPTYGYFINGNDRSSEGVFVTSTGAAMPFTKWYPNEPNDDGDCVELFKLMSYMMNDVNHLAAGRRYICELPLFENS